MSYFKSRTHFRSLNMMLKRRQIIANSIPTDARMSNTKTIGKRILFNTFSGVPSGGIPSARM